MYARNALWLMIVAAALVCCLPQRAEAQCAATRVYLVLDVSGSMKGTKHSTVRSAIQTLTTNHKSKIEFGLATFGSNFNHRTDISPSSWSTINSTVNNYPSNENYTRMGTALRSAGTYLVGLKNKEPASTKNRPYYVILITDGYPTGESLDPVAETKKLWTSYGIRTFVIGIQFNATLLNSIAKEGQTKQAYSATDQTSLNSAFNSIANQATSEVCDGLDNDCDGQTDEGLTRSCTTACGTGTDSCVAGKWTGCSSQNNATTEKCNGKDDDCDGQTDENWSSQLGRSCSVGSGACRGTATYKCKPDGSGVYCPVTTGNPTTETCNGKDDDCDGLIDEGVTRNCSTRCGSGTQNCLVGFWLSCSAPQPQPEKCNGKDDDCNGSIDEDWSLKGKSCTTGAGSCSKFGTWQCNSAQTGITCVTTGSNSTPEKCDGVDNDCNGQVDEKWPDKGKPCGSGTGGCAQGGVYVCNPAGTGLRCSATSGTPQPESCDGLDNDCDGTIDENITRPCRTSCGTGIETCKAGRFVGCNAPQPSPETCNGKDDDCDGQVDNGVRRECKSACGTGNEICINGNWSFCDAPKPKAETCNGQDDDCNGKTDDIPAKSCKADCGEGQSVCQQGVWSDCKGPEPTKETCNGRDDDCDGTIDNDVTRTCKSACGEGKETCSNGQWLACDAPRPQLEICDGKDNSCDGKVDEGAKCPPGSVCQFGRCFIKCREGECPSGSSCEGEICNGNLCENKECPAGRACAAGKCVDPCSLGTCPDGLTCNVGKCIDPNNPNPGPDGNTTPDGGVTPGPDGSTGPGPDTGIGTPGPDNGTTNPNSPNPDETSTGNPNPDKPGLRGGAGSGCICSSQASTKHLPFTLALFSLLLMGFVTRRSR